jgi:enamine deaminase RidA (YjgF/YER057c/UK114 family)
MSHDRQNITSGSTWESQVGYSRAVRVGRHVSVSGTVAVGPDGRFIGLDDPYEQTTAVLRKIEAALHEAHATLDDVVRTRMYVVNIERDWPAIGKAHRAFFGNVQPASSMVQVSRLIDDQALVEIEVDAILADLPPESV